MSQHVIQLPEQALLPEPALTDEIKRFAGANAPGPARMMAAKGLAPLGPWAQLIALHQFVHGDDAQLAEAASKTMGSLPDTLVVGGLATPLPPVVLDTLARRKLTNVELMTRLLLNPNLADDTATYVAGKGNERLTELVAQNQARLLRSPAIIEALYYNPQTRMSTVDRVVDFAARNGVNLDHLPGFKEVLAAVKELAAPTEEDIAAAEAVDEILNSPSELPPSTQSHEPQSATPPPEVGHSKNLAAQIQEMSVPHKVRLALLGNQSARAILIQDTNKVVCRAAIRSPRLSEKEVVSFCKMRSLDGEIISHIANHREWTRKYQVKFLLVQHPKTPLAVSMTFLKTLRKNDLRTLARSKSIPQAVARAAKRLSSQN
ncbi:MAG: hypothetical protein ACE366_12655 [Bradymonadia bacterium]